MKPAFRSFILLLCLCALAVRVSGMHAHVALDHDDAVHEPLAAFGTHHEPHIDNNVHTHDDANEDGHEHVEVSLDNEALSKKPSTDLASDALLLVAIVFCVLLAPRKLLLPHTRQTLPSIQRLTHLRPPLRGPPLLV